MNTLIEHLAANWKSTISGLLTITLTTTAVLLASNVLSVEQATWATVIQALCKAYIALITNDAQTTAASPVSTDTKAGTQ